MLIHSCRAVGLALLTTWATACHDPPSEQRAAGTPTSTIQPAMSAPRRKTFSAASCPLPEYVLASLGAKLTTKDRLSAVTVKSWRRRYPRLPAFLDPSGEGRDLHIMDTLACLRYTCLRYTLVSVFYQHEDCCEDLYYFTFTPDGRRLIDWQHVAGRGANGFWRAESRLRRDPAGCFVVTHVAVDQDDEGPAYYRDSVVTAHTLTAAGRFGRVRVDSVRTTLQLQEP